jgi:predicted nucleic acid-binding protein
MLAVADTSPINYLVLIACETLLSALYTRVMIPPAVWHELQDPDTPPEVRAWVAHPPAWFAVQPLPQRLPATELPDLGEGEREAIMLAQELQADIVLIDEGDGRREAGRRALTVTGTLGVLERAAIWGLIDLPRVLARLQTTTFRARAALFQELLARDAARKGRPSS